MRLQIRLPNERGLAHVAFERSHVRMDRQMRLEDVLVLEILLAQVTLERSLIVVHLLVHRQVRQLLKHLGTDLALICATILVRGAHVTTQSICQGISLAANLAAIGTFVGMRQQVAVEITLLQETRAAHVALIRFLAIVHVHMLFQRIREAEALRAHGTLKATFASMHQHVRLHVAGLFETFATYLAVELSLLRVREYMAL